MDRLVEGMVNLFSSRPTRTFKDPTFKQTLPRDVLLKKLGHDFKGQKNEQVLALLAIFSVKGIYLAGQPEDPSDDPIIPGLAWESSSKSMLSVAQEIATTWRLGIELTAVQPIGTSESFENQLVHVVLLRAVTFTGTLQAPKGHYVDSLDRTASWVNHHACKVLAAAQKRGANLPTIQQLGRYRVLTPLD